MIATHNAFTFKKSTSKLYEFFSFLWRCQNKSLQEQYDSGIRFFDIHIFRKNSETWGFAHGLVNLQGGFSELRVLYQTIRIKYPGVKCRILLEKGSKADKELFKMEIQQLNDEFEDFPEIVYQCIIKHNWEIVYSSGKDCCITSYCYTPILSEGSFWYNLTHIRFNTIKHYAKKHNPIITQKMREDNSNIYFMDFV